MHSPWHHQLFATPPGRQSYTRPMQQTPVAGAGFRPTAAMPVHGSVNTAIGGGFNAGGFARPTPQLPPKPRPEEVRLEKEQGLTGKMQVTVIASIHDP